MFGLSFSQQCYGSITFSVISRNCYIVQWHGFEIIKGLCFIVTVSIFFTNLWEDEAFGLELQCFLKIQVKKKWSVGNKRFKMAKVKYLTRFSLERKFTYFYIYNIQNHNYIIAQNITLECVIFLDILFTFWNIWVNNVYWYNITKNSYNHLFRKETCPREKHRERSCIY